MGGYSLAEATAGTPVSSTIPSRTSGPWARNSNLERTSADAVLLPTGEVLILGGVDSLDGFTVDMEVYDPDPTGGVWPGGSEPGVHARRRPCSPMVAYWSWEEATAAYTSEIVDLSVGHWRLVGGPAVPSWDVDKHDAVLLSDGSVLFAGPYGSQRYGFPSRAFGPRSTVPWVKPRHCSRMAACSPCPPTSAEVYNPSWGFGVVTAQMPGRSRHTATLLDDGRVLIAGGDNDSLSSDETDVWVFDPRAPEDAERSMTAPISAPRQWHTATRLHDGRVLLTGGLHGDGGALRSSEVFHPETGTWSAAASANVPRCHHVAVALPDGRVLVAGGIDGAPFFGGGTKLASAEIYDPARDRWEMTGSMSRAREGATATLLWSGQVLVTGGVGRTEYPASAEIFDPLAGTWQSIPWPLSGRAFHTATLLPSGEVLIAGGS